MNTTRQLLPLILLLITNYCHSQLKGVVINSETKEKIPYVNIWIENKNIGTTTNEKGEFELIFEGTKTIVFSAIGFETKKLNSDEIKQTIKLKPKTTVLNEVSISSKKNNKELVIGKFKKSKIKHSFSCGKTPWIVARFFDYKNQYQETPYLNAVKVLTNSDVKNSKFNIRLYEVDEKGEPGSYIYNKNIIGIAKKGKKITEIDLSKLNIEFPEKGFFIAIEWLIIEDNQYDFTTTLLNTNEKVKRTSYEPSIGTIPSETDKNSWVFTMGKWRKVRKNKKISKKLDYSKRYRNKYNLIAIELTLTN